MLRTGTDDRRNPVWQETGGHGLTSLGHIGPQEVPDARCARIPTTMTPPARATDEQPPRSGLPVPRLVR
jgi:hypothetical protein